MSADDRTHREVSLDERDRTTLRVDGREGRLTAGAWAGAARRLEGLAAAAETALRQEYGWRWRLAGGRANTYFEIGAD